MHFNPNSKGWQFVDTCVRFIILNVLFCITLIPVLTIGPARAALYSTVFAYDDNEDIDLGREYLKRLRTEFLRSLGAFAIFIAVGAILAFLIVFWKDLDSSLSIVVFPIIAVLAIVAAIVFEYYFPLQARYSNSFAQTWKNAIIMPWTSIGRMLFLVFIDVLAAIAFFYIKASRPLFLIMGFSWLAYAKSLIYLSVFKHAQTTVSAHE